MISASFVTEHQAAIEPKFEYTAVAEELHVVGLADAQASVFTTSYFRRDVEDVSNRPVIFAFNGGPGASSYFLHLGLLGPRRVVVPQPGRGGGAVRLIDNAHSPLDAADVVMIDPVGTGYSHALNGHENSAFWGIAEDAAVLANFVRAWCTKHGRWRSPKYLLGESYGGVRAAAMVRALAEEELGQIALRGVILLAPLIDFQSLRTAAHYPLVSYGFLPSFTAVAAYHSLISCAQGMERLLQQARTFAQDEYLPALVKGQRLSQDERAQVLRHLSALTGLSERYLDARDLFIDPFRFMKDLLRERGLIVGRLDGRYVGREFDPGHEYPEYDASQAGFGAAYAAAINDYLSRELSVVMDRPYLALNRSGVKPQWNWKQPDALRFSSGMNPEWPVHVNAAPYLGDEMRRNSDFRILLALGYYDLAVPFFTAENTMYQAGMMPERVTFSYFPTGHLIYVDDPSLAKLAEQIRAFVQISMT